MNEELRLPTPGVLSPADVAPDKTGAGDTLAIGGRLVRDAHRLLLVDALGSIELLDNPRADVRPGDLVVAYGKLAGRVLAIERLELSHRPLVESPPLEFERLALGGVGHRLAMRARILRAVRAFFEAAGFTEVDTPLLSAEAGTELHVEGLKTDHGRLITSPELHMKRLLVGGLPRQFQLAHCFRAGEAGPLHNREFLMLEWYRAFATSRDVQTDTESLLRSLCHQLHGDFILRLPGGRTLDLQPPFQRLTIADAFRRFAQEPDALTLAEKDEDRFFQLYVDAVEPGLATLTCPVFLHDYPASQAALARLHPQDPRVADRFELVVGGIELCNGYGELNDANEQRARCERDRQRRALGGLPVPPLPERFLAALGEGMPPSGGNALGMDRLIALLCGQSDIASVMPFPTAIA